MRVPFGQSVLVHSAPYRLGSRSRQLTTTLYLSWLTAAGIRAIFQPRYAPHQRGMHSGLAPTVLRDIDRSFKLCHAHDAKYSL
jgi:hypothetical protein